MEHAKGKTKMRKGDGPCRDGVVGTVLGSSVWEDFPERVTLSQHLGEDADGGPDCSRRASEEATCGCIEWAMERREWDESRNATEGLKGRACRAVQVMSKTDLTLGDMGAAGGSKQREGCQAYVLVGSLWLLWWQLSVRDKGKGTETS